MPELPEVEACRRLAARHCTGKRILQAEVADDDKVIEGIEPAELQKALQNLTVKEVHRKGKQMWIEFDAGPCLMMHFGMTGSLVVKGVKSHQYRSFKVDGSDWPPKFWKLQLKLEGDVSMAFSDPRRFARIKLQEDPANHPPVSLLGFDPVLSMPALEEFTALIKQQKRSLKALLLDQAFSAGVGNWVADEVLYQAKLYPEVKANSLTEDEIRELHRAIKYVPEAAVEAEADSEKFPTGWLFHVRWDGKKKNPQLDGNSVEFLKVGGRTTAYVPAVQKASANESASPPKAKKSNKKTVDQDDEEENAAKGKGKSKRKRDADPDGEAKKKSNGKGKRKRQADSDGDDGASESDDERPPWEDLPTAPEGAPEGSSKGKVAKGRKAATAPARGKKGKNEAQGTAAQEKAAKGPSNRGAAKERKAAVAPAKGKAQVKQSKEQSVQSQGKGLNEDNEGGKKTTKRSAKGQNAKSDDEKPPWEDLPTSLKGAEGSSKGKAAKGRKAAAASAKGKPQAERIRQKMQKK